ncbi:invasion associated locus B family protein [Wohlfahrtiimonas populi]|uniref:invasion associated locus B family protein n=1 Tax=Wohlfahrtiimonas populi TaxID=1940240 RepID=UPI00098D71CF|nr:invasion associated locus B family protein [Wohlfahrtiimonas populi]
MFKKVMAATFISSALLAGANAQQANDSVYKKKHQDWTVECFAAPNNKKECQMFHQTTMAAPADEKLAKDKQRQVPILRTSITLFDKTPVMVFAAPLDVQLSEGLQIRLNSNDDKGKIYITVKGQDEAGKEKDIDTDIAQINFERCTNFGCIAALPMDVDVKGKLLEQFQKGNNVFVNFTFDSNAPKNSPLHIKATAPLKGFSAAYTDLLEQSK